MLVRGMWGGSVHVRHGTPGVGVEVSYQVLCPRPIDLVPGKLLDWHLPVY